MRFMNKIDLKKIFGINLQRLRKTAGLTQRDLAVQLGSSPSQIAKIESGKSGASFDLIAKLMQVFDCSSRELFEDPSAPADQDIDSTTLDALKKSTRCVRSLVTEYRSAQDEISELKKVRNI